jgi:competence protein ComGC
VKGKKMKKSLQHKNGFPSTLKLIIYILIISALCFLSCLFSGAQEESADSEDITLIFSEY